MPKSSTTIETFVSPEEFREIILDVEKYPEFLPEVKKVVVHERSDSSMLASFFVEVKVGGMDVKTDYTCRYTIDGNNIRWTLDKSDSMTTNEGSWTLEETDDGETRAQYESEIVTTLPIPQDLQKLFADQEMPRMMQRFRDRAEA
jgi:ribosome-associated toxin RatA of RatAB toxin-antitoxin module